MSSATGTPGNLARELGLAGAVVTGLGSIIGTGVFVSIAVAAGFAGNGILVAIPVAAVVATFNGLSSAQLAASHPVSGGTYEYGYAYLHPWLGFAAGWLFLVAKTASAATAALGFSGYLLALLGIGPAGRTWIGIAVVGVVTALVLGGVRRTAEANGVLVTLTIVALLWFVGAAFSEPRTASASAPTGFGPGDVLHAVAFLFVGYTGYGRIATLGEEVRDPARTIPRAVVIALATTAAIYVLVGAAGLHRAGAAGLADLAESRGAPLADAISHGAWIVQVGAILAMLGVLLNLVLGLSRVWLAMGRRRDMPAALGRIGRRGSPAVAVLLTGATVAIVTLIGDVRTTWSFSAFAVLLYYGLTNLAAIRLPSGSRLYPAWVAWAGLASCLFLSFWVERTVWLIGAGILALGIAWKGLRRV